jgi:transposase
MQYLTNTELSSHEEIRSQFNGGTGADIKSAEGRIRPVCGLGIDVHQDFYVVVCQVGGSNPKPPQRFRKEAFLHWAAKLKQNSGAQVDAVYEACGFGFGLQRALTAVGIHCHVVCPQKLDERNQRVKTDGRDAKALCLRLDRFVQGSRDALALVRVPSAEEEQLRSIHRQREQLVKARKQLEAQGRSLMVNHGIGAIKHWWKSRTFAALPVPKWMKELPSNSQPILVAIEQKIRALTLQYSRLPTNRAGLGRHE